MAPRRERVKIVDIYREGSGAWRLGLGYDDKKRLRGDEDVRLALNQRYGSFEGAHSTAQRLFPKAYVSSTGFRLFSGFGNGGALLGSMWRR